MTDKELLDALLARLVVWDEPARAVFGKGQNNTCITKEGDPELHAAIVSRKTLADAEAARDKARVDLMRAEDRYNEAIRLNTPL